MNIFEVSTRYLLFLFVLVQGIPRNTEEPFCFTKKCARATPMLFNFTRMINTKNRATPILITFEELRNSHVLFFLEESHGIQKNISFFTKNRTRATPT